MGGDLLIIHNDECQILAEFLLVDVLRYQVACFRTNVLHGTFYFWLTDCGWVAPLSVRVEKSYSLSLSDFGAGGLCIQLESAGRKFCVTSDFCDRPLFYMVDR
jgi:hypothetical protein